MGIYTDRSTKLQWQSGFGSSMTWEEAIEYAQSLGDGWKLPTASQLLTLLDFSRPNRICTKPIKVAPSNYWTGTDTTLISKDLKCQKDSQLAINFKTGFINPKGKHYFHYVRLVRNSI